MLLIILNVLSKTTIIFQLLLEYDELSWKQRDWFSVYSSNSLSNFPASEVIISDFLEYFITKNYY